MFTLMKIKSVVFCVFSFCFSTHIWGQQINLNKHRVALQGYDVVSYFLNNKAVVGNKALTAEYAGAFYHFSTSKNKAQFDANPARFAPQYGGWCAYAMTKGKKVSINPEAFLIQEDKLYLFYKTRWTNTVEKWLVQPENFQAQADNQWEKLTRE